MTFWLRRHPPLVDAASVADAEDLAEIHAASFHHGWPAAEIEALASEQAVTALVARERSPFGRRRPVGFALARIAADEAEVLTIAVTPAERGRGIGRLLIDEMMRRLYFERVGSVFLEVDETNAAARALYRRAGFREVGRRGNYYTLAGGETSNALVMRADLN
jgi:ribosomal-protein-alanine N-acetyltransferase